MNLLISVRMTYLHAGEIWSNYYELLNNQLVTRFQNLYGHHSSQSGTIRCASMRIRVKFNRLNRFTFVHVKRESENRKINNFTQCVCHSRKAIVPKLTPPNRSNPIPYFFVAMFDYMASFTFTLRWLETGAICPMSILKYIISKNSTS